MSIDRTDLAERLDLALDAILFVRATLAQGTGPPLPDEALDAALSYDQGFQMAKQDFVVALEGLQRAGVADEATLTVESTGHAMVSQAAEVGWHLACLLHQCKPGTSKG